MVKQPPSSRWSTADLAYPPENGTRFEIIDGTLLASVQPHLNHQVVCVVLASALHQWSRSNQAGLTVYAPGLVFDDDDAVVPDLAWIRQERIDSVIDENGQICDTPDIVIEVLTPGQANERRDRQTKHKLYARRGVPEYWVVDWTRHEVEIHRRAKLGLALAGTLEATDSLGSPLLPGFSLPLRDLFANLPPAR
ncbi:MAG TPA: Uma2 family endonuclease [Chloroflexota bacterium]|nr:Uma2 family endonuclease [Chloroflexota bacterium]